MATGASNSIRRWVRRGFLLWAVFSLGWLANSVRTQGVPDAVLRTSPGVRVVEGRDRLEFRPAQLARSSALIFICGSGTAPGAYAPLLRPVAESGYTVFVVGLPYRFAPLVRHKEEALDRARRLIAAHPEVSHWVVAGHSLGGALAARLARTDRGLHASFVLIGTTHPRDEDLSALTAPFVKVYASNDGVAPVDRVTATRSLLPRHTRWLEIKGGNHSQFGHYGHQLLDGKATISRESQQDMTREALLEALRDGGE
jgi:pimeloyl-ACP methyl ester carboxylesterase